MAEYDRAWQDLPAVEQQFPAEPQGNRQSVRFQVVNSRVKIRRSGIFQLLTNTQNRASLVNLSRKGLQVLLTESLRTEENYSVNLYVPGNMDPLIMKAKVVWCNVHKTMVDKTFYRAGFMFTKLSQDVDQHLQRLEAVAA
ncbi:MAG: PilZ domain-containing protein [Thermodesulfobacteriota bacterium]|nr:PilZ domain-containing protein [Thermodesulfobacteriota bacterium]